MNKVAHTYKCMLVTKQESLRLIKTTGSTLTVIPREIKNQETLKKVQISANNLLSTLSILLQIMKEILNDICKG